jgi:hypothetical protein
MSSTLPMSRYMEFAFAKPMKTVRLRTVSREKWKFFVASGHDTEYLCAKFCHGLVQALLPWLFLFVFDHEIHENFFCHFLVGRKGYFGSILSFKTNAHWFRKLFFSLKLYVRPLWFTHTQLLHFNLVHGLFRIVSYFSTLSQPCRGTGTWRQVSPVPQMFPSSGKPPTYLSKYGGKIGEISAIARSRI